MIEYALALVRQTRISEGGVPQFAKDWLSWGAGPRAVQMLLLGGKAKALLAGRTHVSTEDVAALAAPVLRHRIVCNFAAESDGVTPGPRRLPLGRRDPPGRGQADQRPAVRGGVSEGGVNEHT